MHHGNLHLLLGSAVLAGALAVAGCSSTNSADANGAQATSPTDPSENAGTSDLPATGTDTEVRAWLAKGDYKSGTWKCEVNVHEARVPSPHGMNRICSNAMTSAHGTGEFPVGAAAVKELYDATGKNVVGHAVYRKLKTGAGESFYWWEDNEGSVVANGTGDVGAAKSICVGCHAGAGSDAKHSGHDFVYTQVE